METPIIDIENVFGDFVEIYGGIVSDRTLTGPNKPRNADFIFREEKVVAELKALRSDPLKNESFKSSLRMKQGDWVRKGYITSRELDSIQTIGELPEKCYRDLKRLYNRPIEIHIKEANKQIKATKEFQELDDYKGLLFLVSDGNYMLQPTYIRHNVAMLLDKPLQFKSINSAVYLAINMLTFRSDDPEPSMLWINLFRRDVDNVPIEVLDRLFEGWASHYGKVTGTDVRKEYEVNEEGITEEYLLDDTKFTTPL